MLRCAHEAGIRTCQGHFIQQSLFSSGQLRNNHYKTLGITHTASEKDIKDAFLKKSKELHPDANPDPANHDRFVKINNAYSVLKNKSSKREYDFSLAAKWHQDRVMMSRGYGTHMPNASDAPGFGERNSTEYDELLHRRFWENTVWEMRDKSKDRPEDFKQNEFFAKFGIQRTSLNNFTVLLCFLIIFGSSGMLYRAFRYSRKTRSEYIDAKDRLHLSQLQEARSRAKSLGNQKQLEILKAKINKSYQDEKD